MRHMEGALGLGLGLGWGRNWDRQRHRLGLSSPDWWWVLIQSHVGKSRAQTQELVLKTSQTGFEPCLCSLWWFGETTLLLEPLS